MSLRIRRLILRANTERGPYGVDIPFGDGLVILRADNSSGKSACIQAIVYALGLEGMLNPSLDVPLPHAMTDQLQDGTESVPVLNSEVWLEIENGKGNRMALRRVAKGELSTRTRLISAWNNSIEARTGKDRQRDYFVRVEGAATREDGFHYHLPAFLGWKMPEVLHFDGTKSKLYMDCVLPLMVVEQKRGWSGIQARIPQHYRIRDVGRRATEFLLGLDSQETNLKRQTLLDAISTIKTKWTRTVGHHRAVVAAAGGVLDGVPDAPVDDWETHGTPCVLFPKGDGWVSLAAEAEAVRARLADLRFEGVPAVEEHAAAAREDLDKAEASLRELSSAMKELEDEREAGSAQIDGLRARIAALEEDLRKNQDAKRLREYGGQVAALYTAHGECPTCHQSVADSLLPQIASLVPMPIEDNIEFIRQQLALFQSMLATETRVDRMRGRRLSSFRAEADSQRTRIRALKRALTSDDRMPSVAVVEETVALEEAEKRLQRIADQISGLTEELQHLSSAWRDMQLDKRALGDEKPSSSDARKLSKLEELFKTQLVKYRFSSVPPGSLFIDRQSYRPVDKSKYDLEFDLSASDMIRTIWAYVLGLLELSRTEQTNHLGLLILDEPRQQETDRLSFAQLLARAASCGDYGQQVIFATSEKRDALDSMLASVPHTCIDFPGKILQRFTE